MKATVLNQMEDVMVGDTMWDCTKINLLQLSEVFRTQVDAGTDAGRKLLGTRR